MLTGSNCPPPPILKHSEICGGDNLKLALRANSGHDRCRRPPPLPPCAQTCSGQRIYKGRLMAHPPTPCLWGRGTGLRFRATGASAEPTEKSAHKLQINLLRSGGLCMYHILLYTSSMCVCVCMHILSIGTCFEGLDFPQNTQNINSGNPSVDHRSSLWIPRARRSCVWVQSYHTFESKFVGV